MAIEQLLQFLSGGLQGYQREKNSQYQRELMKQDRLLRAQQAKDQADWRDYTSRETNRHNLAMEGVAGQRADAYGEGQDVLGDWRKAQMAGMPYGNAAKVFPYLDPSAMGQVAGQLGVNLPPGGFYNPRMATNDLREQDAFLKRVGQFTDPTSQAAYVRGENLKRKAQGKSPYQVPGEGGFGGYPVDPKYANAGAQRDLLEARKGQAVASAGLSNAQAGWVRDSTGPRINAINAKVENDAERLKILGFSARSMDVYRKAQAAAIGTRIDFQKQVQQFRTAREARLSNQALVGMGDRVRKAQGSVAFMRRMALDQYMKYDLSKMPPEDAARIRDEYTYQSRLIDDIEAGVNQDAAELAGMEEWYRQNAKPGAPPPGGASGPQYTNPAQFGNFAPHPGGTINSSLQAGLPLAPGASPVPLAPPPATRRGTPTPKPPVIKSSAAKRAGVGVKTRPVGASGKPKSLKSMSMDQLVKEVGAARADLKKR